MKRITHAIVFSLILSIFLGRGVADAQAMTSREYPVIRENEHTYGPETAPITFVVFNDTECPFCQKMHKNLIGLQLDYSQDVRIIFRHFPLSSHKFAYKEAKSMECVDQVKKDQNVAFYEDPFWYFADMIMQTAQDDAKSFVSDRRPTTGERPRHMRWIMRRSRQAGVHRMKVSRCVSKNQTNNIVDADIAEGERLGINGTPTTFAFKNGEFKFELDGLYTSAALENVVNELLK